MVSLKKRERLSKVLVSFEKIITIQTTTINRLTLHYNYIIDENKIHHLVSQNIDETCCFVNSATRHLRLWHIAVFK